MGGEQAFGGLALVAGIGSSPRGRGTVADALDRVDEQRFIPAWAGNSTLRKAMAVLASVHPRVGGEQCRKGKDRAVKGGSSPRGRGTVYAALPFYPLRRFIPAWAGNRNIRTAIPPISSVHPRVGGEQAPAT